MRKLTRREIALLIVVAVVVLSFIVDAIIRHGFSGDELTAKREEFQTAQDLVHLAQITGQINEKIQAQVGLEGQVISNSLFAEIANRVDLEALNRARHASTLAALHPALGNKADSLLVHKKQHGEFGSLDQLKKVRGPIFEGEQPQAVISRRISNLARKAGMRPTYQLNVKPMPGVKSEQLPPETKKNLVCYLYLEELADELQQLQSQQSAIEEEAEQSVIEATEEAMEAMFDAWWGTDEAKDRREEGVVETESNEPPAEGHVAEESDSEVDSVPTQNTPSGPKSVEKKADRQFASLPEVIPLTMRIQLLQFIQSNRKQQLAGVLESKKGFLEAQIAVETSEAGDRFLGIGAKEQTSHVKLKPNSALLSKFETLINRYEAEHADDADGELEDTLDYNQQLRALARYVEQILGQEAKLLGWLAKVPSTHQPEAYIVDMRFNNKIERVVRFIHAIESSSKWLQIRELRLSVGNKKETILSTNLSMIAKVL